MELAEAERAALTRRPTSSRSSMGVANVGEPRDPVTAWEERAREQFLALQRFARQSGCLLKQAHLPPLLPGATPGREVTVYYDAPANRVWKATFPGESGFGQFGYNTPGGYLRRLRLSNRIFGDDVAFEGIWRRKNGLSIITSQRYANPIRSVSFPQKKKSPLT